MNYKELVNARHTRGQPYIDDYGFRTTRVPISTAPTLLCQSCGNHKHVSRFPINAIAVICGVEARQMRSAKLTPYCTACRTKGSQRILNAVKNDNIRRTALGKLTDEERRVLFGVRKEPRQRRRPTTHSMTAKEHNIITGSVARPEW